MTDEPSYRVEFSGEEIPENILAVKRSLTPRPIGQYLEDAGPGEVLRGVCEYCGIRSDLIRLPASLPQIIALLQGFERGHARCREKRE